MSTITFACAPVAFLLAYLPALAKNRIIGRAARSQQLGAQDYFNNPRAAQDALLREQETEEGRARASLVARIMGSHQNQLEGLTWFYASLVFAILARVPARNIDAVALAYVLLRVLYIWLYVTGTAAWKGITRSLVFFACVGMAVYLFVHAATLVPKPE
jgi:uncharacterized MAPEG superfamily protein